MAVPLIMHQLDVFRLISQNGRPDRAAPLLTCSVPCVLLMTACFRLDRIRSHGFKGGCEMPRGWFGRDRG